MFEFYLILTYVIFILLLALNYKYYNNHEHFYINMFNLTGLYIIAFILEFTFLKDTLV